MILRFGVGERCAVHGSPATVISHTPTGITLLWPSGQLTQLTAEELLRLYRDGILTRLGPGGSPSSSMSGRHRSRFLDAAERERGVAQRRFKYVQACDIRFGGGELSRSEDVYGHIATQVAMEIGEPETPPSPHTLRRWHRTWLRSGMAVEALLPRRALARQVDPRVARRLP